MADAPAFIFDTARVQQNRTRGLALGGKFDFLRAEIADRMQDRLLDVNRRFDTILDVGDNCMRLTERTGAFETAPLTDGDLSLHQGKYDLIVSNLGMHWVNDLPGMLIQLNRALKPDGFMLASMLGGETLYELRHALLSAEAEIIGGANARVIPFADVKDLGSLLQRAGYALPVTDIDTITVTYEHPLKLMQDLRGMGEANALLGRSKKFLRRDVLMRACEIYQTEYGTENGRIPATFQILYMTGWHPHDSQQKPMTRGSAKMSLADALKQGPPK
ncbi:MAG: methyltransferase domain-containing protein [Kordiimonadaceae bacterium]|nr:methyltransferase domain-containing protein [Kordiimonadaceae bacterium]